MGTQGMIKTFLTITECDATVLMPEKERNGGNNIRCDVERGKCGAQCK